MQTHNSERQAALKRKRNDAEEEHRAKAVTENAKSDARALKRPRIQRKRPRSDDGEETRASKKPRVQADEVEITQVRLKKEPKRAKPDTAPQSTVRGQKKRPRSEEKEIRVPKRRRVQTGEAEAPLASLGKKSKRTIPRAAPRSQRQRSKPAEEATQPSHTSDTNAKAQLVDRPRRFRNIVIQNAMHDRVLRKTRVAHEQWNRYAEELVEGENGLRQLDSKIDFQESKGKDTLYLRQIREKQRSELSHAERCLDHTEAQLRELEVEQAGFNRRIYDFADLSQEAASMECLSPEYWDAAKECHTAYTACQDLELEILELEQTQAPRYEYIRQCGEHVGNLMNNNAAEASPSPESAAEYDLAQLDGRLEALTEMSYPKSKLLKALRQAIREQSQSEARLNRIAHDLLVECKLLPAEVRSEEAAGDGSGSTEGRRSTAENGTQEHRDVIEGEDDRAPIDDHESTAGEIEDQAEPTSRPASGEQEMSREDREERARREAREESNRCRIHLSEPYPSRHAIAAMTSRVADAREKFVFAEYDFQQVRWRSTPDFIASLDRQDQGPAFIEHVQRTGRIMAEAEDERRSALHEAQIAGVIVNEECQSWNFCGCEDQTYTAGARPGPRTPLQISDMQQWLDRVTGGEEERLPTPPDWQLEARMDWDLLLEHGYGEEPSADGLYHQYDIALDRKEKCIASLKDLQKNLRRELQERELRHNAPLVSEGLHREPAEHGGHFDLVEDNHRFDIPWDGVGHGPAQKIPPPIPAEGDLHPKNRDSSISLDINQPWCWGNISKPLFRFEDSQTPAPDEEAQKSPENGAGGTESERKTNRSNNDQHHSNSGSNQPLLYDPSAPLIDYAIDGYDGENMDGIE